MIALACIAMAVFAFFAQLERIELKRQLGELRHELRLELRHAQQRAIDDSSPWRSRADELRMWNEVRER